MPVDFTPWVATVTKFKADEMNAPLTEIKDSANASDAALAGAIDGKAAADHDHDARYYTEEEVDLLIAAAGGGAESFLDLADAPAADESGLEFVDEPYHIIGFLPGALSDAQLLFKMRFSRTVRFSASLVGSQADLETAATAEMVVSLKQNGVAFGTITFSAEDTEGTFASETGASFEAGDVLTIVGPAEADTTAAGISWTLCGVRG